MVKLFRILLIVLLGCFSTSVLSAQEKTQAYYNTHESEILPDAQAAFQRGDYERTIELCKWYYVILGNHSADDLQKTAARCARLSREVSDLKEEGRYEAALFKLDSLLYINPEDQSAQELLSNSRKSSDSSSVTDPEPVQVAIPENKTNESLSEPKGITSPNVRHSRFVAKAGAYDCTLSSFGFGGSLGLYDILGTRIGIEAGAFAGNADVGIMTVTAAFVFRISNSIYPSLSAGVYTDWKEYGKRFGLGLNFLCKDRICMEIGVSAHEEIESSYSIRLAPSFAIGWAF